MQIKCFPRQFLPKEYQNNTVLISMNNYNEQNVNVQNNYEDCLFLNIDDITFKYKNYNLFNHNHFEKIVNFVEKYKDKNFHINCTAGISRSGAIALAIPIILDDRDLFWEVLDENMIQPNDFILSYFQIEYKRYWFSWFNIIVAILNKNKNKEIDKIIESEVVGNEIIRYY